MGDGSEGDTGDCPDAEHLALFARGRLEGEAHVALQSHALSCTECGQVLAAFTRGVPEAAAAQPEAAPVDAVADTAFAFGSSSGGSSVTRVRVGDLILGKYRVDGVVGAGGMGVVVAATHVQIGREVALKFMRPEVCESADAVARFVREARSIAQIQSEHVARLLDVGTLESGEPFMVMELLKGTDLADLVKKNGPLSVPDAVDFVLQSGEAIAEAHRLGIIHRDLKPANLFVVRRPDDTTLVKVLDFGISKLSNGALDAGDGLTGSRTALGSPRYMSPEQLKSPRSVGPATDVWALGCILYELLTGRFAFDGETLHGVALAIATGPTPKVRAVRGDAPSAVDQIIVACLEKDPEKRVQTIADLALLLAPLAPPRARISIERICRLTGRPPPLVSAPVPSSRWSVPVAIAVGALGLAGVAFWAPSRTTGAAPSPAAASAPPVAASPPVSIPTSAGAPSALPPAAPVSAAPPPSATAPPAVVIRSAVSPPRKARATASAVTSTPPPPTPTATASSTATSVPESLQHGLEDRK